MLNEDVVVVVVVVGFGYVVKNTFFHHCYVAHLLGSQCCDNSWRRNC